MYYAHFGLKEPPFKITPNTEVFYTGGKRGAVLDALIYAIINGEGIVKVVGEVGSGKTMLCRMLQTMLPEKIESIYLANPSVAPEDILHAIAFELQLKLPKNADRLKVMQVLQSHLLARHTAGKQVVIFVEEAQGMPLATLEEIRLLSNLETKHDKLLQIVLFGQPELDENLNQTQIRQLRERITHSFNLAPLEPKEIGEYLIFRLRAAGYFGPHLFTKSAVNAIAASAQGLVRRVNILADKALLATFADNLYQVTPKQVRAAIKDSEFGLEQSKLTAKKSQIWMWAALLLVGLALGYLVSHLLQQSSAASQSANIVNSPASTQDPATSSVTNSSVTKPQVSATAVIAPANAAVLDSTVSAQNDILNRRLNITSNWLVNQPATTVSIQLMGANSETQLTADLINLSQKIELDNIYVYRTKVNNQPFLSVLYGSFANRFEASQALKKLPEEIQKNRPQLRTIAGIQKEIQQTP
ncbi:AAA family ATPase [Methylotenera versatilis]|uniref:AAA family ATPase n=1 Tax=Methylotenera versatilis TaxID=1055487 RepID=UPI0006480552|nr:AAA family ATPase [Methylotenera versatilis]